MTRSLRLSLLVLAVACSAMLAVGVADARKGGSGGLAPLRADSAPVPPNIERFIRDESSAVQLGKALFWDMQAGSDGKTACASCHFNAGADNRSRNQLNPHGTAPFTPNSQLSLADFPISGDAVVGSQGVAPSTFKDITDGDTVDAQTFGAADPAFNVGGVNVRRTTGRNSPSAINAVFNFRQFWDGRAQNDFNGVNPFGARDPGARVGHVDGSGALDKVAVSLTNASLASQATGPPGNPVEMSADGRTLSDIGRKLLALRPLGTQDVNARDSVLGDIASPDGLGLRISYRELIERSFQPEWWDGAGLLPAANGRSYPLMQFNFPLFWGMAIQAYEATLVSDKTPFDNFMNGDSGALSAQARQGLNLFAGKANCAECHNGAELSNASVSAVLGAGPVDEGGGSDTGFFNIGVRPTASDAGNGGTDPFGTPLSEARLAAAPGAGVDGSFKVPDLRNVELTAPYFHNGGKGTLRQVIDLYNQGGDFANAEKSPNIQPLGLTDAEKDDLVAFLDGLTDPRVRDQSAPFDHPQLFVPVGAQTQADGKLTTDASGRAMDCFRDVPATGSGGGAALPTFPGFTGPPCDVQKARPVPAPGPSGDVVDVRVLSAQTPARTCRSRRNFTIRLFRPRGDRFRRMVVSVNGRRVSDVRGRKIGRARVDLRGLPRGVVRVKVTLRTVKGRSLSVARTYRTCTSRRG